MLVELRSTGGQTVIPPSVHPSGEEVQWTDDSDGTERPRAVDLATLRLSVRRLACATLAAKHSTIKEAGEWITGVSKPPSLPDHVRLRIREWQGVEHCVTVREHDYEYQGRPYKSLSAVARAITGTRWNGWTFFGLKNRRAAA